MSEPQQPSVPPYAQPGPYPAAPTPQPYPSAPGATETGRNPLARAAFIVSLITLGLSLLFTVAVPIIHIATDFQPMITAGLGLVSSGVTLIGGTLAVILGLIALRRAGGHALAGIAVGIGGSGLLGVLFSWGSTLVYSLY